MDRVLESFGSIRADDADKRTITAVISTGEIARDNAIIDPAGWIFDNYLKNPVILWAHDDRSPPIGRTTEVFKTETEVIAKGIFDDDAFSDGIYQKIKKGLINAVSVRWNPLATETREVEVDDKKKAVLVFIRQELLEWSPVPIPADPGAVVLRATSHQPIDPCEFDDLMEEFGDAEMIARVDAERPYPNEHACRLRDPSDFQAGSFRRVKREHEGKEYSIIMGRLKGKTAMTEQAYRYPKDKWSAASARAHCKAHDGKMFEPAASEAAIGKPCTNCGEPPQTRTPSRTAQQAARLDRIESLLERFIEGRLSRPSVEDMVVSALAKITGKTEERIRRELAEGA